MAGSATRRSSARGDPPPGSPAPKSTSDWTFLAVAYDDWTGQMTVYVDLDSLSIGEALEVVTSAAAFGDGQATVAIGGLRPDNADEGWQGAMDNVFFYDEVLTLRTVDGHTRMVGRARFWAAAPKTLTCG